MQRETLEAAAVSPSEFKERFARMIVVCGRVSDFAGANFSGLHYYSDFFFLARPLSFFT